MRKKVVFLFIPGIIILIVFIWLLNLLVKRYIEPAGETNLSRPLEQGAHPEKNIAPSGEEDTPVSSGQPKILENEQEAQFKGQLLN
jgi:hypothetical protein